MKHSERQQFLANMVRQIAPHGDLESLRPGASGLEGMAMDAEMEIVDSALRNIETGNDLNEVEMGGLEAIVLPRGRPVFEILKNQFQPATEPWTHLNGDKVRPNIDRAIPSIGRIELPSNPSIPYGGTGFVVGDGLIMTNRHVARLFATGVGRRELTFLSNETAAVDFLRERNADDPNSLSIEVREIVMIHPYWDMALLRVEGLDDRQQPLKLSVQHPGDLNGRDVAVVGYPAKDFRNNLDLQNRIFGGVFNVKRMQPGIVRDREMVFSFGHEVSAITHDSSTLGGNSGSALIDVAGGEIVGLHFAGRYLKANYAVPTYELARDSHVVDAGVNFSGRVEPTNDWANWWRRADHSDEAAGPLPPLGKRDEHDAQQGVPIQVGGNRTSITIPLHISVTLGDPQGVLAGPPLNPDRMALDDDPGIEAISLRVPIIHGDLESRKGYDEGFLELAGNEKVPLPKLTAAGKRVVAELDDDTYELKYHRFSIVMHKKRRMALFTAANVDGRESSRTVDGRRPSRRELTGIPQGFGEQWVTDPRIPDNQQLPDRFYTKDRRAFDKGHLVRRDAVCWGDSFKDIQRANGDTYHTTNCSPQVSNFNQSSRGVDNWGDLENLVQRETKREKVIVFSGPVFADADPEFRGVDRRGSVTVQIPRKYWKIIVTKGDNQLDAYGFVLEQDLSGVDWELAVPMRWRRFMKTIGDIENLMNGLVKLKWLKEHDQFGTDRGRDLREGIALWKNG